MRHRWYVLAGCAGVALIAFILFWPAISNGADDYTNIDEHFKFGSIGSEPANGLPYWIWKALPVLFADKLPGKGYASLGFIQEAGHERPVGFSLRRVFIDRVSLNCGVCHTGSYRDAPGAEPHIVAGMPANTMNLGGYTRFLLDCAQDDRFTVDQVMDAIERSGGHLNVIERTIYRRLAIPQTREELLIRARKLRFIGRQPEWGPGRVDTFNPYKALQFNFPMDALPEEEAIGTADLPSIWQQRAREGMQLHWDGNNSSVEERNKSAALGAGVTPVSIDLPRIKRIEDWLLELTPPAYPYPIDRSLAAAGQLVYRKHCASCHGESGRRFAGSLVGKVVPIEKVGTDRRRLDSFTYELLENQNTLYAGYAWRFNKFRKTDGYACMPLDGIWLRAPYLHNGSVPTMRDLLNPPGNRPRSFYRGNDVVDRENLGFVSTVAEAEGRRFFRFETSLPGNSAAGHVYGVSLSSGEKAALIEALKTF
jgi:hypothetical protein